MEDMFWPISIPVVAIVGAFVYGIVQTLARARVRELEVRERIAMIERGLVPPPEKDPNGFDRAMHRYDRVRDRYEDTDWRGRRTPNRYRSAGITLMGVGFGLMLLITFSGGDASVGIGVGGFMVVMGLAFLVNSLFSRRPDYYYRYPYPPPPPPSSGSPNPPPPHDPSRPY
jgi:hypothetical protein